VNPVNRLFKNP